LSHPATRLVSLAAIAALAIGACSASTTPAPSAGAPSTGASSAPSTAAGAGPTCVAGSITASGSTALQPLVDAVSKKYVAACTGATVSVQGGGSGTGLTQVLQGAVQIGDSDVTADSKLKPDEASQLVDHVVARQGWVMVINKGVTGVTNLTTQQATDIWTGKITNWKDVGGNDAQIVLVFRPASSGTRSTFKKIVLNNATEATSGTTLTEDSNGAVTAAVKTTPGATSVIGFVYFDQAKADITGLQLDGVDASVDNMKSGTYKLQAFGHMYTKGTAADLSKAFLDYVLSPDIQNTLLPTLFYAPAGS
jgi:phosphate transport system substrate-binding protein